MNEPGPDVGADPGQVVVDEQQLDRIAELVSRHPEVADVDVAAAEQPQLYVEFRANSIPGGFQDAYGVELVDAFGRLREDDQDESDDDVGGLAELFASLGSSGGRVTVVGIYQIRDPLDVEYLAENAHHEVENEELRR